MDDQKIKRESKASDIAEISKNINDYLNHYVTVTDTKAGALAAMAAFSSSAASYFIGGAPSDSLQWAIKVMIFAHCLTLVMCGVVVYPRKPSRGDSLIFWEDVIGCFEECSEYQAKFHKEIKSGFASWEYSSQNYHVSKVLSRKNFWLRGAIMIYGLAVVSIIALLWWPVSIK